MVDNAQQRNILMWGGVARRKWLSAEELGRCCAGCCGAKKCEKLRSSGAGAHSVKAGHWPDLNLLNCLAAGRAVWPSQAVERQAVGEWFSAFGLRKEPAQR